MEERESNGGFVTFKSSARPQTVTIPEHLRSSNMPDPLAHLTNKKPAAVASTGKAGNSDRQAALAALQAQREKTALRLKELEMKKAKSKSSSVPPPPPPSLALSSIGGANKNKKT